MSSVSVGLEVLAIIAVLIVVAVVFCCVGVCMFHMMDQEMQRTQRMMIEGMQRDDIGGTSIQVVYDPEEDHNGQNGQMVQNSGNVGQGLVRQFNPFNFNVSNRPMQAGTTTETRITTTISRHPNQPTHDQSTNARVYIDEETQRLAAVQQPVFTATDNDHTQQSQQSQRSQNSTQQGFQGQSDGSVVVKKADEMNDETDNSKQNNRKKIEDSTQLQETQKSPVSEQTHETKVQEEEEEEDADQLRQSEPFMRLRYAGQPKLYTPAWRLTEEKETLTFDEYQDQNEQRSENISNDQMHDVDDYDSDDMREWDLMIGHQTAFISAQEDQWNDAMLMAKKTN